MRRLIPLFFLAAGVMLVGSLGATERRVAMVGEDGAVFADDVGQVRLSVPLSQPVPWRVRMAADPPRLVVEFTDVVFDREPTLKSTSIAATETARTGPQTSELVAVLREPLAIATAEMTTAEDGTAELQVLLLPTTATAFHEKLDDGAEVTATTPDRLVIAIDPGHGGVDPGAEVGDLREADLVLRFCGRLRDALLSSGRFDAVLTREADEFVSLDERLTRARDAGADVLLSIHADALEDAGGASGLVIYSLKPGAAADANQRLTERHAPDSLLTGVDLTGTGDDVALALLELARGKTELRITALSTSFATALSGAGLALNTRPERKGEFAVLKAADIPSVLIELGFLSTEADLDRLTDESWQTDVARAMVDALMLWEDEDRLLR